MIHFSKLSLDAKIFLWKVFTTGEDRIEFRGRKFTPRAIEASCELIESGYLDVTDGVYCLLTTRFPKPSFKLNQVREAYDNFEIFLEPESPQKTISPGHPLVDMLGNLARIQTDLLSALKAGDMSDPVARLHVLHAIQGIERLQTEDGVKRLETLIADPH